jgi:SagB-type dehydrogenase family enzyme
MKTVTRVRRARHLVTYWTDEGMVITNYATGAAVIGDALVAHILDLCRDWITLTALQQRLSQLDAPTLKALVSAMTERQLLVRHGAAVDRRETALDSWHAWNPAAGFFHLSTKNVPTPANREKSELALRVEARERGVPSPVKRYPRARSLALPAPKAKGAFPRVLLDRRTWRSFGATSVALADISTLLNLTLGVQRTVQTPDLGTVRLKTSPSSGARQPLEGYILARSVEGLAPGLYHYVADGHTLELVKRGATTATLRRYIPGQWWYDSAAALFLMTAVFARTQWRYRFARAYRSVLLEAGHVCQTFCLVATWLGLAPFCTGRFADAYVERQLRIDGVTESFVYGGGVGSRPAGARWAPWALDGSPEHPLLGRRVPDSVDE